MGTFSIIKWVLFRLTKTLDPLEAFRPDEDKYSAFRSWQQGIGIGLEWFFEQGPEVRVFGPEDSLTVDLSYDKGLTKARQDYAAKGYPPSWYYYYEVDELDEESGPIGSLLGLFNSPNISKSKEKKYLENLEFLYCSIAPFTLDLRHPNPEGNIDLIGISLGSYHVLFDDLDTNEWKLVQVWNRSHWQSFARVGDPEDPGFWHLDTAREDRGPGGTIYQLFWWIEPKY